MIDLKLRIKHEDGFNINLINDLTKEKFLETVKWVINELDESKHKITLEVQV